MFGAFTSFGKLGALASSVARAWSPLALWPDGISTAGMWISPSTLPASFNDSTGTTPVATPGTVADSANPVGLALDIRSGAPDTLGPELVTNGDFSDGTTGWTAAGVSASVFAGVLTLTGGTGYFSQAFTTTIGATYKVTGNILQIGTVFTAIRKSDDAGFSVNVVTLASSVSSVSRVFVATAGTTYIFIQHNFSAVDGKFDNISVKEIPGNHMLQASTTARPLLSAYDGQTLGPGDTYDATGYPIYQKYDGTDDSMATASFAAGTLINGMDCMIPVRRDAGGNAILCFDLGGTSGYFGLINAAAETAYNCGTPTVFVDGVQLAGGTLVMGNTLASALPVGELHIVEFRNLDLSTWTRVGVSGFAGGGYLFNGASGDIMLFPSPADAADRDNARQYLADLYGVTLP